MKIMKYAVAAALAASALSGTAQAATIVTGPTSTTVMATLDPGANNNFSISFSDSNLGSPTFNELLTFTTDVAGMLSIQFGSTLTSADNDVDFSNAFLTGTGINGQLFIPQISGDPNEIRALNFLQVGQGTFTLNILGNPGTTSGSLGGTVAFQSMAAVPEPGTWAMMLLGFGAIGFSMRRRRQSSFLSQVA